MGIVFGITGTKEPTFNILSNSNGYQIRSYQKYFIAEVNSSNDDNGFRILAKYIGVFGKPENVQQKPMDMTAPVILDQNQSKKLSMTSPVISSDKKMSFVLPFEFNSLEEIPKPTNKDVSIRLVPEKVVAVDTFSGWYTDSIGEEKLQNLCKNLKRDGILKSEQPKWHVAQYHPPFTIPFLRRNEIWVELSETDYKPTQI